MGLTKEIEVPVEDMGRGVPQFAWQASTGILACCGFKGTVCLYSRSGKKLDEFSAPGTLLMEWSDLFHTLALLNDKGTVVLYNHKTKKVENVDTGMKDLCFLSWSPYGSDLVVGSRKGGYTLYNRAIQKKTPVMGAHSQTIIGGAWTSTDNFVVMAGADKVISVSDTEGNVISSISLPCDKPPLQFSLMESQGGTNSADLCLAVVSTLEQVVGVNIETKESFTSAFPPELGTIKSFSCGLDQSLCIAFSSGVVGLATFDASNMILLVCQVNLFSTSPGVICVSKINSVYACIADNHVKFLGRTRDVLYELKELTLEVDLGYGAVSAMAWSPDEQHFTVATFAGRLVSYSISVTSMSTICGNLVFYFVSNKVINIKNLRDSTIICSLTVDVNPAIMAAGMGVLAIGTDSKVFYYSYYLPDSMEKGGEDKLQHEDSNDDSPKGLIKHLKDTVNCNLLSTMEYPSPIADLKVSSEYAAILVDGQTQLHSIRDSQSDSILLPPNSESKIIAIGLSENFFMYVTASKVCVMTVRSKQVVAEYTSRNNIRRAFPNPACTRVALIGDNNTLYVLNPITEVASPAEGYRPDHMDAIWDQADSTVFVTFDSSELITFICSAHSRHGPTCESILVRDTVEDNLVTPLPMEYRPIGIHRGIVVCRTPGGTLDMVPLRTHAEINSRAANPEAFYNNFSLNRLRWSSQNISTPQEGEDLAVKALHMLDIELAIRVYRQLSQPCMVMCLEKIKHIHEKNLLIGHVSMILGYIKDAQNFFLRSSQPLCALEMRRDLMHWEPALQLARDLAEDQVPIISKEYAQQLEYRGDYVKALEMYKNGQCVTPTGHAGAELTAAQDAVVAHNQECLEGTARCYIHSGSIAEGVEIALKSENKEFINVCAKLCEEERKFDEAAQLYEKADDVERAAALYIEKSKNLKAAGRLLPLIQSRNIIGIYAAAKEKEAQYKDAEEAYAQAEDWENSVRLKVEKLNDLTGAYDIVRKTKSADAAALVANMCKRKGDYSSAIEFLVLCSSLPEAFELAKEHNLMFSYESALLKQVPLKDGIAPASFQKEFGLIAAYYDRENRNGQAGLFYTIAGNFSKALQKFMQAGEPEDIDKAVEVVGKARNESLTSILIDYLMGETDGEAKEPSYIFKLYMSLGSFEKAAKTSTIIAIKEQEIGNYRLAHKTLVEATQMLREKQMRVPNDVRRCFMLLHSYIIVKDVISVLKDEATGTRLLLRVARNIQKFPLHIPEILSSTVTQCTRAGFKKSAFDFACLLIQQEKYRLGLPEKDRKRVEGIVRKSGKDELVDPVENFSPCPFCEAPVLETELDCGGCKNMLPLCIVTGKHVVKSDFTLTPCCKFPATYSALLSRIKSSNLCPACNAMLDINKIERKVDFDFKVLQ